MGIRLPWRRLQGTINPFGPLVPVLFADLATFHSAAYWLWTSGHLTPNEPQLRLNLALAVVATAACGAWYLLRALGRASAAAGTALAIAGYALVARIWCEFLVIFAGRGLETSASEALRPLDSVLVLRVFALAAFAWGLGAAAGEVAAELRGNGPRAPGRAAATRRAGGGVASAGP